MRIYRDVTAGVTWIERGTGVPLIVASDHGSGVGYEWRVPDPQTLIYDDEHHVVEHEQLDDARDRLIKAVAESKISPTAKSDVRRIIADVLGPAPSGDAPDDAPDEPVTE